MEYTVKELADIAGVSSRTLRYYDQIGLLRPAVINESGYRIYRESEVDKLQQILFFRELGMDLSRIKAIMSDPTFDRITALKEHRHRLLAKEDRLKRLIRNLDQTIALAEGRGVSMTDREKFEGFKEKLVEENEQKFGKEARQKYGDEAVGRSNQKLRSMTEDQYNEVEILNQDLMSTLKQAYATQDPASDLAQKAADLHRQWLTFYWDTYSEEAHASLAQMYVGDERFKAFYDKEQPGTAEFLRDAILIYTGMNGE